MLLNFEKNLVLSEVQINVDIPNLYVRENVFVIVSLCLCLHRSVYFFVLYLCLCVCVDAHLI